MRSVLPLAHTLSHDPRHCANLGATQSATNLRPVGEKCPPVLYDLSIASSYGTWMRSSSYSLRVASSASSGMRNPLAPAEIVCRRSTVPNTNVPSTRYPQAPHE